MKKTTLALAALIALTSGAAMAQKVEKKDYQLNFAANIDSGFSFERLDGKSWSEAIELPYSNIRGEFDEATIQTRVNIRTHGSAPLKAYMDKTPTIVNKQDLTKSVELTVALNNKNLSLDKSAKTELVKVADNKNEMPLTISVNKPTPTTKYTAGDYEGTFAIIFEYGA